MVRTRSAGAQDDLEEALTAVLSTPVGSGGLAGVARVQALELLHSVVRSRARPTRDQQARDTHEPPASNDNSDNDDTDNTGRSWRLKFVQ